MAEFEKVIGTITVNKNILQVDNQFAGNMFSSDLTYNVNFTDDFWNGFEILEWYAASSVVGETVVCKYDSVNKKLKIPYGAYIKNGPLYISMRGIKDSVKYSTNILVLVVGENINIEENDIVNDPSWLDKVQSIIDDVFVSKYDPQYEALVQKVEKQISTNKELLDKTQEQQTQIDNAIDIMGNYEIVQDNPTQIRFKKGDGTYGDTVNLGDNLASKSMVNAGYDTYSGNSYSGSASDYGIEVAQIIGAYEQDGTPTPDAPIEPQFVEINNFNTNSGNLFDASKIQTTSKGGATVTNNGDGSFTVNGSGSLSSTFSLMPFTFNNIKKGMLYSSVDNITYPYVYVDVYWGRVYKRTIRNNDKKIVSTEITQEDIDNNVVIRVKIFGDPGKKIIGGTFKLNIYQDGDGTWYPFNADSTPLSLTLRALPNGVKDTYENGVITRRVGKVVFDGSSDENFINITQNNDGSYRAQIQISSYSAPQTISNLGVLSNKLKPYEIINTNLNDMKYGEIACGEYSSWNGSRIVIAFPSSCSTIELCKQWLQSNPIKVWYQLATPTTEQNNIILQSYYPFTNAWHDSEVEASDLTWNILTQSKSNEDKINDLQDEMNVVNKRFEAKQLLINPDFQINQRGQTEYNFSTNGKCGLDMWQHRQGNYTGALIVTPIKGGGIHIKLGTNSSGGLRQVLTADDFKVGQPYTAVVSIDNTRYKGTLNLSNSAQNFIENDLFKLEIGIIDDKFNYSLWIKKEGFEGDINYCDLWEGDIAYPHIKEDYAIALMRCQKYISPISGILNGFTDATGKFITLQCDKIMDMEGSPIVVGTLGLSLRIEGGEVNPSAASALVKKETGEIVLTLYQGYSSLASRTMSGRFGSKIIVTSEPL